MKSKIFIGLLLLLSFVATFNLWHAGFPLTHDGDVHLMRLTGFYQSLTEGIWIPRWAADVNWGYGQPVFEFFYPLPLYVASILHFIGFSFANSLKIILGASLILSGLTMYLWLSKITSRFGAFVGSFLYIFAPYRFVDLYVRGDIGENAGLIFIPLVLLFVLLSAQKKNKYAFLWSGFFLGMLILSHNIVSLMALPFILFYGLYIFLYEAEQKRQFAIRFVVSFLLGFSLSAFFWMPGLFEGKYTLRDIVTKGGYATNFTTLKDLFYGAWSYGISGQFTTQLGIFQWLSLGVGIISLFLVRKKKFLFVLGLCVYTLSGIFLMLPQSTFVWSRIILLQNFQFPWRFLIVTTFGTSVIAGILAEKLTPKLQIGLLVVLIIGTVFLEGNYWHAKGYAPRPNSYFAGIIDAPSDTGESTPIWGVRFMEHQYKAPLQVLSGKATITVVKHDIIDHQYTVMVSKQASLMENTLYFPGWHVLVDKKEVPVEFQNENHRGLMIFSVPEGKHTVRVYFDETKFRLLADYLSLVGLLALIGFILLQSRKEYL